MNRLGIVALMLGASVVASNAETFDWSGGYIGAQIGGRWAKNFMEWNAGNGYSDSKLRPSGLSAGGYAGYNLQFDRLVAGADVSVVINTITKSEFDHPLSADVDASAKLLANFNARTGYAIGRYLPYATAGISYATYENFYAWKYLPWPTFDYSEKINKSGWNVGVGVDVGITTNIIGRVEYRYVDLGKCSFNTGYEDTEFKCRQQTATLGIAYKF